MQWRAHAPRSGTIAATANRQRARSVERPSGLRACIERAVKSQGQFAVAEYSQQWELMRLISCLSAGRVWWRAWHMAGDRVACSAAGLCPVQCPQMDVA